MHSRTTATIEELECASWFSRVGFSDTNEAIVVSSWTEAVTRCSSIEWENHCLEALNQYRERLAERSKTRFNRWNEVATEIKKTTVPFVKRKIADVVQHNKLPES